MAVKKYNPTTPGRRDVTVLDYAMILPSEKIFAFNMLIHAWEEHLKGLMGDFFNNWPFIYNSYQQLFEILYITKDHLRIADNGIRLAKNLAKKEAAISNGFNFIFVIDKDYNSLIMR